MAQNDKRRMIISKTPLRVTFVGGGTDIPEFYRNHGPGVSIAAAINKYVYTTVHKRFDSTIRVAYSKTEIVSNVDELQHPTIREALKLLDIDGGIEITNIADMPSGGTGMGSSSAFLVGLLNALHAWKGEYASPTQLAREAVKIEREILKEPGGKQDQYIAALGGMQFMEFHKDESVVTTPLIMPEESRRKLQDHLLMLYTGTQKAQAGIHDKMAKTIDDKVGKYKDMVKLGYSMFNDLSKNNWQSTGRYLHENWLLKKETHGLDDPRIDGLYDNALNVGAVGGKVLGAGNRGFFMFFAPPEKHERIKQALPGLRPEPFAFEPLGSRIIYVGD